MDALLMLTAVAVGFVAMLSGGFWGLGGGWLIMPALLLLGVDMEVAVVASLLQMVPSTFPTVVRQLPKLGWTKGSWGLAVAVPICAFSFLGSLMGKPLGEWMLAFFNSRKPQEAMFMAIMLLTFFETVRNMRRGGESGDCVKVAVLDGKKQLMAAASGIITGAVSSLLGIGGGSLVRPILKSFLKVPEKIAGMILRFSVLIVAVSGSAVYLLSGGGDLAASIILACAMTAGGMPGFALGARMHATVIKAGKDKFADASFSVFVLFIIASLACKLLDCVMLGRCIILAAGVALVAFLFALTRASRRRLDGKKAP